MAEIPYDIFLQAGKNWDTFKGVSVTHPQVSFGHGIHEFIGCDPHSTTFGDNYPNVVVPDESVQKWQQLASPHFMTILKAWEIRNGQ